MTPAEAEERLAQAIRDHAEAFRNTPSMAMLNEFAIVAHWQPVEDNGTSEYTTHYHRQNVPTHTAVGLFSMGVDLASFEPPTED